MKLGQSSKCLPLQAVTQSVCARYLVVSSNVNSYHIDLLNTSKKKADYLKSQICDKFQSNLGKTQLLR